MPVGSLFGPIINPVAGSGSSGGSGQSNVSNPLRGVPATDNTFTHASGSSNSIRTTRKPHTVLFTGTDIRFVYGNWFNQAAGGSPVEQDTDNPASVTIAASCEIAGVKYRLTFNGLTTIALAPGGLAITDPLPVQVALGSVIYSWTSVNPTTNWYVNSANTYTSNEGGTSAVRVDTGSYSTGAAQVITDASITAVDFGKPVTGTNIPANSYVGTVTVGTSFLLSSTSGSQTNVSPTGSGTTLTIGGDLTAPNIAAATIPDSSTSGYVPNCITMRPLQAIGSSKQTPVLAIVGDSVAAGSNDTTAGYGGRNITIPAIGGGGFVVRALESATGIGYIMAALSGDQASLVVQSTYHFRRWTWLGAGTSMLCEYGRNDLSNARTLAQIQANLITIWSYGAQLGQRVFQTTITPYTDSTDGWTTTGNQTSHAGNQESIRVSLNTWIRAGAPVTSAASLTPVAVGTPGALVAGQPGHPLFKYWEIANTIESAQDSGLWAVNAGRQVTDGHITSGQVTYTSATANFTAADLGKTITVAGAGAAGAILLGMIQNINSTNSATLIIFTAAAGFVGSNTAGTTVTTAVSNIGVSNTVDGLHPVPSSAILMAAGIITSEII